MKDVIKITTRLGDVVHSRVFRDCQIVNEEQVTSRSALVQAGAYLAARRAAGAVLVRQENWTELDSGQVV